MIKNTVISLADSSVNQALYLLDSDRKIEEKLSSMSDALLKQEWTRFQSLYLELKDFKLSQKYLNKFGQEQLKDAAVCGISFDDMGILREMLGSINISEKFMDKGYDEGTEILRAQTKKEVKISSSNLRRLSSSGIICVN